MGKIKVALNGFGSMGHCLVRALYSEKYRQQFELVAINELINPESIARQLQHDAIRGDVPHPISLQNNRVQIGSSVIELFACADPKQLNWRRLEVDIVIDCSSVFCRREHAQWHINGGARRVLYAHSADSDVDATVVFGINQHMLTSRDRIVSSGSCISNAMIPVIDVLDRAFGVKCGSITTIRSTDFESSEGNEVLGHGFQLSQAAGVSVIPVKSGLSREIERVLPKFKSKFEAIELRSPAQNVITLDLCVTVCKKVTVSDVNQAIQAATQGTLQGILNYTEKPLVSIDLNHNSYSCIVTGSQTHVSDKTLVKVLSWCGNEWGFANRILDTAQYMANL
ncbi:glyceraldehyde 3-phosphate dehydrogenase NAD-binding domain-containing protein [Celerinatantimonas sp. YJH-8]|uniref:glyceraldehyde 3-phosphate dehydrogenase NAD-binding domain-containing protein n=1 Tax=Celerinatantimonas sp. YJH-8 TaxID=3228714 RepID=UPI0038C81DE6